MCFCPATETPLPLHNKRSLPNNTTQQDAGSAEVFKKVDYEYVAAAAKVAKAASVPYFGLVSAQVRWAGWVDCWWVDFIVG